MSPIQPENPPPGAWRPARQLASAVTRPLSRFLHIQAASGIILLVAALVAIVWSNSQWGGSYERLWHTPVVFEFGPFRSAESLHFWINDGLMVIFFFVVGLEIRREIHEGELSELKRAALPVAAALGGMVVPALIYAFFNADTASQHGWGVPMATDIAFAVGVLALLGSRVPAGVRVLLLALAIIDDIGAIIVIALFYSSNFSGLGLLIALIGIVGVVALQKFGVRNAGVYVIPGVVVWYGVLRAGIHPTIAGVILGLMAPARAWFGEKGFLDELEKATAQFKMLATGSSDKKELLAPLHRVAAARREAVPPVIRIEDALHGWVAYVIMPLFALANAGVHLGGVSFTESHSIPIILGVGLGLLIGKPAGIFVACFITIKLGIATLPRGLGYKNVLLVGLVAGIGFTMAIFIAGLAFNDPSQLGIAKFTVLMASLVTGVVALTFGRWLLPPPALAHAEPLSVDDAEASTEY